MWFNVNYINYISSVILLLIIGVVLSKKHFDDEIKKLSEHIKLDD